MKDYPNMRSQVKGNGQAQASGPSSEDPYKNFFYALMARGEQESFPVVVTSMLQVFFINVYSLIEQGATISFLTPLVAKKFDVLLNVLVEPFRFVP